MVWPFRRLKSAMFSSELSDRVSLLVYLHETFRDWPTQRVSLMLVYSAYDNFKSIDGPGQSGAIGGHTCSLSASRFIRAGSVALIRLSKPDVSVRGAESPEYSIKLL